MPPAAPQATIILMSIVVILSFWPTTDATDEPIWTIGPSLPAEQPEPSVMADARALSPGTLALNLPLSAIIARMTSATPAPLTSGASQ